MGQKIPAQLSLDIFPPHWDVHVMAEVRLQDTSHVNIIFQPQRHPVIFGNLPKLSCLHLA